MIEFGEKIRNLRENKGMTQQTLADKLHVTRQAISRWECGARYPDIFLTKQIAQILEVTVDELLSGEEYKKDIEKEPVLYYSTQNSIQTILYTVAVVAHFIICCLFLYNGHFTSIESNNPLTLPRLIPGISYFINLFFLVGGLILSVQNRLNASKIGFIMSIPYILTLITTICNYTEIYILYGQSMKWSSWISKVLIPLLSAIYILLYFNCKTMKTPIVFIIILCAINAIICITTFQPLSVDDSFQRYTINILYYVREFGLILLLLYQSLTLYKKRTLTMV